MDKTKDVSKVTVTDDEGFSLIVQDNYGDLEKAKEEYEKDNDTGVIFVGINCAKWGELCVALTAKQAEKIANSLQSLIKYIKGA